MGAAPESKVFIGIGSNMGDRVHHCVESMSRVLADPRARLLGVSSLYLTSPVSPIPQDDYVNGVLSVRWSGSPRELLALLNGIESSMGRVREEALGPRIIDLDILLFGDLVHQDPALTIPHPEFHKRRFTVVPSLEIEPTLTHPLFGKPVSSFLASIDGDQKISLHMEAETVRALIEQVTGGGPA